MNVHKNARLTSWGRERLARAVLSGQTPEAAARAAGVCPRTARKWVARFKSQGIEGLKDRSSRPHRLHRPTPMAVVERIEALRRQRFTGGHGFAVHYPPLGLGDDLLEYLTLVMAHSTR